MVRTVSQVEDEEANDSSSPTDSKRADRKGNSRSKHSETEQRRRSKINERFQVLRDLIPENDQKRDKASFLLEVIQYIQFLQEKLQMYEGSCQGWSSEPTKILPWRMSSGLEESFPNQPQLHRTQSGHETDVVLHPTLLIAHNSVESELNGSSLFKPANNQPVATKALPMNIPIQTPIFEGVSGEPHFWPERPLGDNCSVPVYASNEEEVKSENREASISNAYSQGLMNSLTNALQSSGVDLSQSRISVQLDIRKRTNGGSSNTVLNDQEDASALDYGTPMNISENYGLTNKRFRAD